MAPINNQINYSDKHFGSSNHVQPNPDAFFESFAMDDELPPERFQNEPINFENYMTNGFSLIISQVNSAGIFEEVSKDE